MASRLTSTLARSFYLAGMTVGFPAALLLASPVLALREKRRRTLLPRLGFQRYPSFERPALWLHALSVGELLSAVPLLERLRVHLPHQPVVASVSTLSAHRLAQTRLGSLTDGLIYFPYDIPFVYGKCLARIRPSLFVLVETDIWPGYLPYFRERGVSCVLVNGRLSQRSFAARKRWSFLFDKPLAAFDRVYPQSAADAVGFTELGVSPSRLGAVGNLKFDACGAPAAAEQVGALRASLGYLPEQSLWVAGSTHPGEEEMLGEAFTELRKEHPELRLICVPRHPERGKEVTALFSNRGLRVARYTECPSASADVLIVDAIGLLNRLYGLARIAFVGGSLVRKGGQNPIEPAMAGVPVLFGPYMGSFPSIAEELLAAGAAFRVQDAADLAARCSELLRQPEKAAAAAGRGQEVVRRHRGVADRIALELQRLFPG